MSTEAQRLDTWIRLWSALELAGKIADANPAELIALLTASRKGIGREGEHSFLAMLSAIKQGAAAQIEVADAALATFEAATKSVDEAAMAALDSGSATQ
jgi:hypothetical protein